FRWASSPPPLSRKPSRGFSRRMSSSNQTYENEDDSEYESEDDEGRSCCCQGLIQQRKRKVCFEDLEYSNEADFPEKGICFFSEKVSHHPTVIACHNVDSSSDASCLLFDCILLLLVVC
ncbi:unnamed protein product, partial [Brassica oleracea var. botrytis]